MTDPGDTDDAGAIFSILVENSTDMLVLSTPDLRRLYVSPSCSEVLGYSSAELLGQTPFAIVHPEDRDLVAAVFATLTPDHPTANVAWRGLRPNGEFRWLETTYRRLPDGRIVAVVRDIQQRKAAEEQLQSALSRLERLAMYDPLTGIPNRRAFLDTLEHRLSSDGANHHAVLLVDLDDFKPVNDRYGHAVGDDVLTGFARRLENVRATILPSPPSQSWLVARLGGDEFAVLLNSATLASAEAAADGIVKANAAPMLAGAHRLAIAASVGVTLASGNSGDTKAILLRADLAMYEAKRQGGAGYCLFEAMPSSFFARQARTAAGDAPLAGRRQRSTRLR